MWTRGLTRRYGRQVGCADVSLAVPCGSVFGLLGRNGSGKSTIVRMLVGLVRPSAGQARVLGHAAGAPAARRQIGFLPEVFRHPEWATGLEVLQLHATLAAVPPARTRGRIAEVLEVVGLGPAGHRPVGGYSKGMQQRLGIAVALLGDPPLVFLDEPTSALDPVGRREVRELLVRLRQEGRTVFLNSHLLGEAEQVCDRVAILHAGRLVASGPLDALLGGRAEATVFTVRADDEAARAALEALGPPSEIRRSGDLVRLRLPLRAPADVPRLVAAVVAAGGRVYGVETVAPSLEDAFLRLVGGED